MRKNQIKIAVIGDIHDQWEEEDGLALKSLGVDLVLFVGDFGDESVENSPSNCFARPTKSSDYGEPRCLVYCFRLGSEKVSLQT